MRKMNKRLIINDFKSNKLINISTCLFMAVTAMLLGLSIYLFASLVASIDTLMNKAETPHFLQMHTGDPEEEAIREFADARGEVDKYQISTFLNLQNSQISIGDKSLEGNMQDNGLCTQSKMFDYLLEHTDPELVFYQMDVYWTVIGKASPVDYFERYPGRFKMLHIKDEWEVGQSGMVGFDAIFKNAEKAGLENFVVEIERYKHDDILVSFQESADYLLNACFVKPSYVK